MNLNFKYSLPALLAACAVLLLVLSSWQILSPSSRVNGSSDAITKGSEFKVYFAGGQSNMDGYGYTKELPEALKGTIEDTYIFNGNQVPDDDETGGLGMWMPLSSGFGTACRSSMEEVQLSDRFGPELSFGYHMAKLSGEKVAIIKYARGGSSLAANASGFGTWDMDYKDGKGINQWDNFQKTVHNALADTDIDGDGLVDKLIPAGIIWMQGESDAIMDWSAKEYESNLTNLIDKINGTFGVEDLPVVICRIEDFGQKKEDRLMPYIETVWEAQEAYVRKHENAAYIKLDPPVEFLQDRWHYKSNHYLEMGEKFAQAIHSLSIK